MSTYQNLYWNKENADTDSTKSVYMSTKIHFFITASGSQPGNQPKAKFFKGEIEQNFSFAEVFKCLGP